MTYSSYAVDQQSCKDHNQSSIEDDIKSKVNASFIGGLKDHKLLWGFDKAVSHPLLMTFSIAVMRYTSKERRVLAIINKQVMVSTVSWVIVKHRVSSHVRPSEFTPTHETNVRNQYSLIVDHVADSVISSFRSVIHAFDVNPIKGN